MKKLFLCIIVTMFLPVASFAFPPDKDGEKSCAKCHTLSTKEAETILQKLKDAGMLPPSARFKKIEPGPVKGTWAMVCEIDGRKTAFLVDYAKKHFLPQVVPLDAVKPQLRKVDRAKISLKDAMLLGAQDAKKKVIVFTDPDCPACRQLHEAIKKILASRKDISFSIMMFPLPQHKEAYKKAQAVLCSKSASLLDDAYAGKAVPAPTCPSDQLERSIAVGKAIQLDGTPTMIRDDGMIFIGPRSPEMILQWIDGK